MGILYLTNLFNATAYNHEIKWNSSDNIDEEPAFEIMQGNLACMGYNLIVLVNVCCPEVDENVNDEHDIDDQVDDSHGTEIPCGPVEATVCVGCSVDNVRFDETGF